MTGSIRKITIAAAALGVVAAVAYIGVSFTNSEKSAHGRSIENDDGFALCLKNEVAFFEGLPAGCYSRAELAEFRDAPVIDRGEKAVAVAMTHPSNASIAPEQCTTCREFSELRWRGWFASSSYDMRREAYFVRACGVLDLLMKAEPASLNYFEESGLTADEIAAIGADAVLRVGGDPEIDKGTLVVLVVEKAGDAVWRLTTGGQETRLEEIATADFDGDGIAEILAFLVAGPAHGTARVAEVALLEKDSSDSPLVLTPQLFFGRGQGTAGEL